MNLTFSHRWPIIVLYLLALICLFGCNDEPNTSGTEHHTASGSSGDVGSLFPKSLFTQRIKKSMCDNHLHIQSINLFLYFDHRKDGAQYEKTFSKEHYYKKQKTIIDYISAQPCPPDIIAVQEAESKRVLNDLTKQLKKTGLSYHYLLVEGNDRQGIDVGYLYRDTVKLKDFDAVEAKKRRSDGGYIHDRPPLSAEFVWKETEQTFNLINVHLRSMRGIDDPNKSKRILTKRRAQAGSINRWLKRNRSANTIMLGDFNTPWFDKFKKTEPLEIITQKNDLHLLTRYLPEKERYSYIHRGKKLMLDHMLISEDLVPQLEAFKFVRGYSCSSSPESCHPSNIISDHDPLYLILSQQDKK